MGEEIGRGIQAVCDPSRCRAKWRPVMLADTGGSERRPGRGPAGPAQSIQACEDAIKMLLSMLIVAGKGAQRRAGAT